MSGDDQTERAKLSFEVPTIKVRRPEVHPAVTEWAENWRRQQGRGDAPLTADDAGAIGRALLKACGVDA